MRPPVGIDDAEADGHACHAAARTVFMERNFLLPHMAIRVQLRIGHRRAEDSVFERHTVDGDRACQIGEKFVFHVKSS